MEEVFELVGRLVWGVGDFHNVLLADFAEPALLAGAKDFGGFGRLEELAPYVENLLQHGVDFGVDEGGISGWCAHWVVENGAHGHADHADVGSGVSPLRSGGEDVVEDFQEMVVVTDLLPACGVLVVRVLHGDFLEHGDEEHVHAGVVLDELLEFLQDWDEFLRVVVHMLDLVTEPFSVESVSMMGIGCQW